MIAPIAGLFYLYKRSSLRLLTLCIPQLGAVQFLLSPHGGEDEAATAAESSRPSAPF